MGPPSSQYDEAKQAGLRSTSGSAFFLDSVDASVS